MIISFVFRTINQTTPTQSKAAVFNKKNSFVNLYIKENPKSSLNWFEIMRPTGNI